MSRGLKEAKGGAVKISGRRVPGSQNKTAMALKQKYSGFVCRWARGPGWYGRKDKGTITEEQRRNFG